MINLLDSQEFLDFDTHENSTNNSAFFKFYNFIIKNSSKLVVSNNFDSSSEDTGAGKYFFANSIWTFLFGLLELIHIVCIDLYSFITYLFSTSNQELFTFEYKIFLFLLLVLFSLIGLISVFWYILKDKLEDLHKFQEVFKKPEVHNIIKNTLSSNAKSKLE